MNIGQVVEYSGALWKVSSCNKLLGTFILESPEGRTEVARDAVVKVLSDSTKWPFVALPTKPIHYGPVSKVTRNGKCLLPMLDWVPGDFLRAGGTLFLNPKLKLCRGEILVVELAKGAVIRSPITVSFGSTSQRKKKAAPVEKKALSVYDMLLNDD